MWRMCAKQWSFVVKNSRISHLKMVTIMVLVFLGWNLQQHTFIGLNFFTAFYGVCHAQGLDHCPDVIIILCPNISDLQIRGLKYNFPDYTVKHWILKCSKEVNNYFVRRFFFFLSKKSKLLGIPKFRFLKTLDVHI